MLKLTPPSRLRRSTGMITGLVLASAVVGSVYAASATSGQPLATASKPAASEYQLDMMVASTTDDAHRSHADRTTLALCMAPGESGSAATHGWKIDATTVPDGDNRVRIDLAMMEAGSGPLHLQLHAILGEPVHTYIEGQDGKNRYAFDVTPLAGCPARTATTETASRLMLNNEYVKDQPARATAESIASKAGLTLVNPEALDNRLVTLNFEQIPAELALQLIADVGGKMAVFDGNRVHFEPK